MEAGAFCVEKKLKIELLVRMTLFVYFLFKHVQPMRSEISATNAEGNGKCNADCGNRENESIFNTTINNRMATRILGRA